MMGQEALTPTFTGFPVQTQTRFSGSAVFYCTDIPRGEPSGLATGSGEASFTRPTLPNDCSIRIPAVTSPRERLTATRRIATDDRPLRGGLNLGYKIASTSASGRRYVCGRAT